MTPLFLCLPRLSRMRLNKLTIGRHLACSPTGDLRPQEDKVGNDQEERNEPNDLNQPLSLQQNKK